MFEIIKPHEITRAADILSEAFCSDPLMKWIFVDEQNYIKNSSRLFATWIKYCILYGIAWRTAHFESVALRRDPEDKKFTLWRMFRSGMIKTPGLIGKESFNRLMKFDELTTKIRNRHIQKNKYLFCWILGTAPKYRTHGFAHILTQATFNTANSASLTCHLETAEDKAKLFHVKNGFSILSEDKIPGTNIVITSMLKFPDFHG